LPGFSHPRGYKSSGASAEDQGTPASGGLHAFGQAYGGLGPGLTARKRILAALDKFAVFSIVSKKKELEQVGATFSALAVKTPSMEAPSFRVRGNQQKVVMSRALLPSQASSLPTSRRRASMSGRESKSTDLA
jgi:hypothetical protein